MTDKNWSIAFISLEITLRVDTESALFIVFLVCYSEMITIFIMKETTQITVLQLINQRR